MLKIRATYEDNTLSISNDGEVIRTVKEPKNKGIYRFKVDDEEYFSIFETYEIRGTRYNRLYLYPLNKFKNNEIEL